MRRKGLMLAICQAICWLSFTNNLAFCAENQIATLDSNTTHALIRGRVCDLSGKPLAGVQVWLWYLRQLNDFPYSQEKAMTNAQGRYAFRVNPGIKYYIRAGEIDATVAESGQFTPGKGEIHQVEDLAVRRATSTLKGVILDEKGKPAADLRYYACSESFSPMPGIAPRDRYDYARTSAQGEFYLPHVLPDEPISLWVVLPENTVRMWRRLSPGAMDLKLAMKQAFSFDMPEGWEQTSFPRAFAFIETSVREGKLSFTLPDLEGKPVSLDDARFKGKVVLVNLWGTWCGGCQQEVPHLVELQKKYGDQDFAVIGIAFEEEQNPAKLRQRIRDFTRKRGVNYTLLLGGKPDKENVEHIMKGIEKFRGYPTNLYLGRDGRVHEVQVGFASETAAYTRWQLRQMERVIEKLVKKAAAPGDSD